MATSYTGNTNSIADSVDDEQANIIRLHYSDIAKILAVLPDVLLSLSDRFYQHFFIDLHTKSSINMSGGLPGASMLLDNVMMKIEQSDQYLPLVLDILREEVALKDIVQKMEKSDSNDQTMEDNPPEITHGEDIPMATPPPSTLSQSPEDVPSVADTTSSAERLKGLFEPLCFLAMVVLSRASVDLSLLKLKISLRLQYTRVNTPEVQRHLIELEQCPNGQALVTFLIRKNLLGYLNFDLLDVFAPILSSDEFNSKFQEYQLAHEEFMKNNHRNLVEVFQLRPDLRPASVPPPKEGGYDDEIFLTPPPIDLQCPVCHLTVREPHQLSCCGSTLCQVCSEKSNAGIQCPCCRDTNHQIMVDKKTRRRVMSLQVKCTVTDCHWIGKLLDWNKHIIDKKKCPQPKDDSSKEEHRLMKLAKDGIINGRHVRLRALKGILIGGPGVGKTITFKRLTNRRGNIEKDGHSRSTGVEKPDTVHLYRDIENASVFVGKCWLPQPLEGELSTLFHCLQQNQVHVPSAAASTTHAPSLIRSNMPTTPAQPAQSLPASVSPSADVPQPRDQSAIDLPKIYNLLKLGKLEDVEKMIEEMGEITVLYMMDLGGQPEYFEILPLLLRGPFLGIIFINLSLSLTEPFKVTYRHTESTHSAISYTASYCQIDMVHQVLALIDALCPDHTTQSNTTIKSHACLIGTHKDASSVDSSTISAYEKEIKESLKGTKLYYLLKMLYRNDDKANFIFPIDNLHGDEEEIEGLREALTDQIYDKFESEEINIRWGIFHLLLRSEYEEAGFCSLDEAVTLGLACGLQTKSNVTGVLEYLHFRFGTILYYHKVDVLRNRVICDPNAIFRPLTLIIADSFGAAQHNPQIAEEIRETGIVPLEIFNKACKKNSPADHKLSTNDIVELLKCHEILSEIAQNGESILFMPCLLQPYSASGGDQQPSKDDYRNAFLFTFTPYGFQPIGLFYTLTAKLLNLKDFELGHIRFRNKISFLFGTAHIEILSMFHHLKVRVASGHCSSLRRVSLRLILIDSIMKSLSHTKNIEVGISFYCPVSINNNDPHPAELHQIKQMDITEKPRNLKCNNCCRNTVKIVELTKEQEMWFEDSCPHVSTDEKHSEYDRWKRLQSNIFEMFNVSSQTVGRLTVCALAEGLVPATVQESVNEKVKVYTTTERANILVQYLHSKAKINEEGKVFHQFIECLKEDEYRSTREKLVKEHKRLLSKSTTNASAQVFQNSADALGELLAGPNLFTISMNLKSKSVLTEEEYSSVVHPESYHTSECLNTVLKHIGLKIKHDPKKLYDFINILENEGPYYSDLVKSLKGSDPD